MRDDLEHGCRRHHHHHQHDDKDSRTYADNKPQTLAALMSSSATHSAIVLMFLKAASRAPVHSNQMACKQYRHSSLTANPNLFLTPLAYHTSNNIHFPHKLYLFYMILHSCMPRV
jgi:hypothetical protein